MQAEVTGPAEKCRARGPVTHGWIVENQHPCIGEGKCIYREFIPTDRYPVFVESEHRKICPSSLRVATRGARCATDDETEESKCALRICVIGNTNQDR